MGVAFYGSAAITSGHSLNDVLMSGPVIQEATNFSKVPLPSGGH